MIELTGEQQEALGWARSRLGLDAEELGGLVSRALILGWTGVVSDSRSVSDRPEIRECLQSPPFRDLALTDLPVNLLEIALAEEHWVRVYASFHIYRMECARLFQDLGGKARPSIGFITATDMNVLSRKMGARKMARLFGVSPRACEVKIENAQSLKERADQARRYPSDEITGEHFGALYALEGFRGLAEQFGIDREDACRRLKAMTDERARKHAVPNDRGVTYDEVMQKLRDGDSPRVIASRFGLSLSVLNHAWRGTQESQREQSWESRGARTVPNLLAAGLTPERIASIFHVSVQAVHAEGGPADDLFLIEPRVEDPEPITSPEQPPADEVISEPRRFSDLDDKALDAMVRKEGVRAVMSAYGVGAEAVYERIRLMMDPVFADEAAESERSKGRSAGLPKETGGDEVSGRDSGQPREVFKKAFEAMKGVFK